MTLKVGDIVRHPDGSLGVVVPPVWEFKRPDRVQVHWVVDTRPGSTQNGYSYDDVQTLELVSEVEHEAN